MSGDRRHRLACALTTAAVLLGAVPASPEDDAIKGRFSLFAGWADRESADGTSTDLFDVVTTLSLAPGTGDARWDYRLDIRASGYPGGEHRDERISIYEAWIGTRTASGRWRLRLGQVWVRELGALGRVGGVTGELQLGSIGRLGKLRAGAVAGLDPKILDPGYRDGVRKGGLYLAVDGGGGRRHVLGWALLRKEDLTERSVVVLRNFLPVRRTFFLYQALEYDLEGPGGLGNGRLTYLFTSARLRPTQLLEVQATYHRGRSIDTRTITQDVLDGRPVDPARLDGLLFESGRLRLSVMPKRGVRVWAGFGRDRHNRSDEWSDRVTYGLFWNDLAGSGVDLTAGRSVVDRSGRSYDSTSLSLGRALGARVYASVDYVSSLSVFTLEGPDGGTVELRPESERWALSLNASLGRRLALLLSGEWLDQDQLEELRFLAGVTVRF